MTQQNEAIKDSLGKGMPKPIEYWRDMLDAEIMDAVWRGQQGGCHGNGLKLSDLAHERLNELLCCGNSGLSHLINKKDG